MKLLGGKFLWLGFSVLVVFLLFPNQAKATSDHLVINELLPNPNTDEKEWVEIYNPTAASVDFGNYVLMDGSKTKKTLSGFVDPDSYFVLSVSSGWLNNDGEILFLLQENNSLIIDQAAYGNWSDKVLDANLDFDGTSNFKPAPAKGQSISRIPNGQDTDVDKNDFRIVASTPGTKNVLPVYPDSIKINEVLPAPANGQEEFVELYNTGDQIVDLSGWQLDDAGDGSSPYPIPDGTTVDAGGYLIINHAQSKIYFNDSGDSVRLFDPNGDLKDMLVYDKAKTGFSFANVGGAWQWTNQPTPYSKNQSSILEAGSDSPNYPQLSIDQAKELKIGSYVKVRGKISVKNGVLSKHYFYLEDNTGGLQIYSYDAAFPELVDGQPVEAKGELSSYHDELRLKVSPVSDILVIQPSKNPPPAIAPVTPKPITGQPLLVTDVGRLVSLKGKVIKNSGQDIYLSHQDGPVKVYLIDLTGIKKPRLKTGRELEVTGILSYYDDYFRLLPRYQSDIKVLETLPNSGSGLFFPLLFASLTTFLIYLLTDHHEIRRAYYFYKRQRFYRTESSRRAFAEFRRFRSALRQRSQRAPRNSAKAS